MKEIKAGQIVQVFQKPLTSEEFEGNAKLIRKAAITETFEGFEYWYVRFINEKGEYVRLIKILSNE